MTRVMLSQVLLIIAAPDLASANAGRPTSDGFPAGDPSGIVDVAITHEELVIDLRPLADRGLVLVRATYHLDSPAGAKQLDLVFASGVGRLADFQVALDNRMLASKLVAGADLPKSWRPPATTPLPEGGDLGFDVRLADASFGFQLDVAPGAHELVISYAAEAVAHHARQPTILHQFAYVLSPARTWGGFGGLDVTVQVAPGWIMAVTPAMTRAGDTFTGTYPAIPADAIALTARAPLGAYSIVAVAAWVLLGLVTIGGGVLVYLIALTRERRRARAGKLCAPGLAAFGLAALWATAFLAAALFMLFGSSLALPDNQVDHRGYAGAIAALFFMLLSVGVFALGIWLGLRGGRRAHPDVIPVEPV